MSNAKKNDQNLNKIEITSCSVHSSSTPWICAPSVEEIGVKNIELLLISWTRLATMATSMWPKLPKSQLMLLILTASLTNCTISPNAAGPDVEG